MGIIFNGGFMKPMNLFPTSVKCNVKSDTGNQLKITDENSTYKSQLFPTISGYDSTVNLVDPMELRIFWDQTTDAIPNKPTFVESPPDDYHPMFSIEFSAASAVLFPSDNGLKTPHFIVKKDSTSPYYGKDHCSNYLIEPLRNFGGRFTWFNGDTAPHSSYNTFNGGDLCVTPGGLHLAFSYLKAPDATAFISDLYYSKFSDLDGTFQNPILIEQGINVAGMAPGFGGTSVDKPYTNMRSDPKFLYIPNTGLLLSYMGARYNYAKDTTEWFIHMKISKDDGSNWTFFNELPFNPVTNEKETSGKNLSIIEVFNPQFGMIYAENKLVVYVNFTVDNFEYGGGLYNDILNIYYSEDLGKSFKTNNFDFSKIVLSLSGAGVNRYESLASTMYYDKKLSKFVIAIMSGLWYNYIPNPAADYFYLNTGISLLTNRDGKFNNWDISFSENLGNTSGTNMFPLKTNQSWMINTWTRTKKNYVQKMNVFVDNNDICNLIFNGSMDYRGTFDSNGDFNKGTSYNYIPNPLMIPLEFNLATDSYLNQLMYADIPWRARKLSSGSVDHKNGSDTGIIEPLKGASLSQFQDGIAFEYNEAKDVPPQHGSDSGFNPDNRFSIHRMVDYKNNRWALGTDTVFGTLQEHRAITYQIPMILNRPDWSNVNFKPRKICYFNPMRHYDSTFRGWVDAGYGKTITGSEKYIEYPPFTKKYWEAKFLRKDSASAGFGNGIAHYNADETALSGNRGATWDMDSTRGFTCHFICSLDSGFYKDITSMVHMLSVPNDPRTQTNKTILSTFLGKDFIGFRSSGSGVTNNWQTNYIDATRNVEVMTVVAKKWNSVLHNHRTYVKYKEQRDWTFMYNYDCAVGSSFNGNAGVAFGNLLRWPDTISGDATNVVYFKYHAESWSALGMTQQVNGSDNLLAVLPQPCTPTKTYLPNGVQIAWNGQDATANATFKIRQSNIKNSADKILDLRPNVFWRSMDGSATLSIDIDFGKSINFDTISLYKHNLYGARFFYGQENNTTDMTAFLYHEQFLPLDSSTFVSFADYEMSVVGSNTLLIYSQEFTRYVKVVNDDIIGRSFQFFDDGLQKYFIKKCKYYEILDDSSTYVQFEDPSGNNYVSGINRNFTTVTFVGAIVQILEDKHLYVLPNPITARYIRMDLENVSTPFWGIRSGIFTNYGEVNFDGYFKVGCLSFGNFQKNENPIQNGLRTKYNSPNSVQTKNTGQGVSLKISDVSKRNSFTSEITAAEYGYGSQFEQVENFVKDIGVGRDVFYFAPRSLTYPDGQAYPFLTDSTSISVSHGFSFMTTDFYMVKMVGSPTIRRNGDLASMTLQLDEVI